MSIADVHDVVTRLERLVHAFDPDCCDGATAARYATAFAKLERLAVAGKIDALARVDATKAFLHDGSGTANTTEWLATATGTSTTDAARLTRTARGLTAAPATRDALRRGELSTEQATEITRTAAKDPGSERAMLEAAQRCSVEQLRAEGMRRRAAADDPAERRVRQQRLRGVWRSTDDDGMRHWHLRLTPEQNTTFESVFDAWHRRSRDDARRRGDHCTVAQHGADAVTAMATALCRCDHGPVGAAAQSAGTARRPAATVHAVLVADVAALRRGHAVPGETCDIAGVGPIDAMAARALLGDAIVDIVIRDGIDVRAVAHTSRAVNRTQKAALLAAFECVVAGCNHQGRIELDHLDGWANTHTTRYETMLPVCEHHHRLKTYKRWWFSPPDEHGKRIMHPPGDRGAPNEVDRTR